MSLIFAKYIVLNDLNFSGVGSSYGSWFYGEIDFQGHHVERHAANGNAGSLITHFRAGAVMKNLVLDFYGDNTSSRSWWYGIITYHYGTIDNLMIKYICFYFFLNIIYCQPLSISSRTIFKFWFCQLSTLNYIIFFPPVIMWVNNIIVLIFICIH